MIDKLTPRFLDKSSDEKLVQKTSFVDALNIYVDGDFDSESAGVIKAIKGMEEITPPELGSPFVKDWFCLGHVVDQNTGIVYFFMVSERDENHGIWAYDHRGVLPSKVYNPADPSIVTGFSTPVAGSMYRVATSNLFNFPSNGHVAADIVYSNSNEFAKYNLPGDYPEKDVLLYFTDNKNEPRMVNAYRAFMNNGLPSSDREENYDFINACPRVPLQPITFEFKADDSLTVNNFATTPGFQFAYQNIYKDGLESAISPYSKIAFPPSIINRGATEKDNILAHNRCDLTIPAQNAEVEFIRVLARYGNGANFIEIDEIENPADGEPVVFTFLNDRVAGGVSTKTTDKTFDNLPRKAESQAVVSNRLIYGNYVEGFDNVDCSGVELTPIYGPRPLEILNYEFSIKPSIEFVGAGNSGDIKNKTIGFKINAEDFADVVDKNTKVSVSFSFAPDKNFHIYNTARGPIQQPSYHQSRQVGENSLNLPGYNEFEVVNGSAAASQDNAYQNTVSAGAKFLMNQQENYFGFTPGVGKLQSNSSQACRWKNVLSMGVSNESPNQGSEHNILFGTSAANPLILQGTSLSFSVSFIVNLKISSGARSIITSVVTGLLAGDTIQEIAAAQGFSDELITVVEEDLKISHEHNIDLGLSDYDSFPVNGDIGAMITGAGRGSATTEEGYESLFRSKPPSCAFLINKARVPFYLERVENTTQRFRICIENIFLEDDDSVMTCVRDLDPASPWWAISENTLKDPEFEANFPAILASQFNVPNRVFKPMAAAAPAGPAVGALRNFTAKFASLVDFTGDYPEVSGSSGAMGQRIMESCFGYFVPNQDENGVKTIFPTSHDGSASKFNVSMLDGEGGPGGTGSGGDAYSITGCQNYGSIAGQVFLEYDDSSISKARQRGYVRYTFSGNPSGGPEFEALQYIGNTQIAADLGLESHNQFPSLGFLQSSVLMGPYYTGRIVLNNITPVGDPDIGYVNPAGTSMFDDFVPTTTLPLVWFSSWGRFNIVEGTSDEGPLIKDNTPNFGVTPHGSYGELQVSFPYPIVLSVAEGGGGFEDGELISGTVVEDPFGLGYNSVDFERLQSHCEANRIITNFEPSTFQGGASFKAGASHEFGIVYYDERGRHGYVNPIGSTFVKTLGERDGDDDKGPAFIKVSNITHSPPEWAKAYRFVYSKNTSIDKFVQYNAGGAFVANSDYEGGNPSEIYVSLNYLQGHPISYANSFGAKGEDGTPVLYSFTPGDRLRVVSYMLSSDEENISRLFPNNYEFEVTGVTQFTDSNNPFAFTDASGSTEVKESMKGLFLVLKNNIDATGFRYQDIEAGSDNWGSNCIFEIYSPVKEIDSENRLYYEIGDTYPIIYGGVDTNDDGIANSYDFFHKNEEVILTEGDVFFRRHAVNLRDGGGASGFIDLLDPVDNDEEVVAAEANFKSYYLESEAATDLFPSRALSIGRPNIIKLDARESNRESSLIHSERDIVESSKVGYSSFNRTIASDLEIDFKAGPIHYLCNHQDSVFFIQNNKCGHIPVDRTLISDVGGSQSLIASSKFLGTPRYYAGDAGCDGNPESVVNVDTTAYFVNKSRGKVYKVHPSNGVNVISDLSMSGFFREELAEAVANGKRIIGGYDPIKKEYLLSIVEPSDIVPSGVTPEVDEEVFQSVVLSSDEQNPGVVGGEFIDESEVEEPDPQPVIRFDWNYPSNLSSSVHDVFYEGGVGTQGDLVENLSVFATSANGLSFPISGDVPQALQLTVTVENYEYLQNEAAFIIRLAGIDDNGNDGWTFDISDLDNNDVVTTRAILTGDPNYLESEAGLAWNFTPAVTSPPFDWIEIQDYATATITGSNDDNPPYAWRQIKIKPNGGDPGSAGHTHKTTIRFLCSQANPGFVQTNFNLQNVSPLSATVKGRLVIEASSDSTPFKVGSFPGNLTSKEVVLNGNVNWQQGQEYADISFDVDAGGVVYEYNPCHPVYGLWQLLLDENGAPSQSVEFTFGNVGDLLASNIIQDWIDDVTGGGELTEEQNDALEAGLTEALTDLILSGGTLSCPNINYVVLPG